MLNVGIIGAGKMGRVYARWFDSHPECRVAAFYNRTRARAEELSAAYPGSTVYDTWQELSSDPSLDIVGICTPSHEHLEQIEFGLAKGKHLLCEKPMANDVNECRQILDLSRAASTKLMVGFQMRFHPVVQTVDVLLDRIGDIYHIDFTFSLYRPGVTWRHQLTQGGGVLKELSSHLFDLMWHWAGDISSVTGTNRIIEHGREVEDYSINMLEFAGGASGMLFSSYLDRRSQAIKGNIQGVNGQISFQFSSYEPSDSKVVLYTDGCEDVSIVIPKEIDAVYPGHLDSFKTEIDHFVDAVLNDKKPLVGAEGGLRALEVIDASYESTRRGGVKVSLPLIRFSVSDLDKCFPKFTRKDD